MPFNIALSGIRAASKDLSITGNNIANASTTGFKSSRAEFGDVYATSVLGAGNNPIGSGVRLQDVSQRFTQGSVAFTENEMDLAINGNGFFVVRREGEQFYTRAGAFGLDRDGFVTSNTGAILQGFPADENGNVSGLQDDIRIQTSNLSPRPTTLVESLLNLDSSEEVLQSTGTSFSTEGNAISVAQVGLEDSTSTSLPTANFGLPLATDFSTGNIGFSVELTASSGNNGTVNVLLNTAAGVPATIATFNDLRTLAGVINAQIFQPTAPQTPIDVIATAVDAGGGNYRLDFTSLQEGEGSQIRILNGTASAADIQLPVAPATAVSTPGIAAVNNGYPQQSIDITDPDGNVVTYTSALGASAASIGSELNALAGVSATATTTMRLVAANYNNVNGNMQITLNGVTLATTTLDSLGDAINALTSSTLPGISAELDAATGDLVVTSSVGDDLRINIESTDDGDSLEVLGNPNAPAEILEVDTNSLLNIANATAAAGNATVVGGTLAIVLAEGYTASNPAPPSIGLFGPLTAAAFTDVVINQFDPTDQSTYNHATSMTIYDSLGNPHVLTQYFVRQEYDVSDPTTSPNHWVMHIQIDGRDVGDPDTTLPPPENTLPTRASFDVRFNEDGSLNQVFSDQVLISNWTPRDANGNPNGALGPQNVLAGGNVNIPEPPTSSNFVVDLEGTTQFGSIFSVNDVDQNGYTTGRLSGLNIDESGFIFARFTNGESQVLGQVILADFANNQGLQPVGDSMWAENYESGPPNIGTPRSAALGAIQAGALEESNVDLSEELVHLIIAQRNFQASAKTIETANQVTQTVINLR
jgi:flagellar hook protein FlgE